MHIPSCPSQEIDLISFEEALARSGKGDDYDHDRWIYVPDFYTEYRYILGTRGDNPLICIGINPSTAEPDNLDNTLKSVSRIAAGNGFDSFIMFNVYAQRATSPDDMDRCCNEELHRENMKAFDYLPDPGGDPSGRLGRLGSHHRKAGLSPLLCGRYGLHRRTVPGPLALCRKDLRKGTSPPSAVSAKRRKDRSL